MRGTRFGANKANGAVKRPNEASRRILRNKASCSPGADQPSSPHIETPPAKRIKLESTSKNGTVSPKKPLTTVTAFNGKSRSPVKTAGSTANSKSRDSSGGESLKLNGKVKGISSKTNAMKSSSGQEHACKPCKTSLPYKLSELTWESGHRANAQKIYCYCGKSGNWYLKMLQCNKCRQWFHEACLSCLKYPLLYGDLFYVFICAKCHPKSEELLYRLPMMSAEVLQLALFHYSLAQRQKYAEVSLVSDWITQKWSLLQTSLKDCGTDHASRTKAFFDDLLKYTSRFKSGAETRKKKSLIGLRVRVPPVPNNLNIPSSCSLTVEAIRDLVKKNPDYNRIGSKTHQLQASGDLPFPEQDAGNDETLDFSLWDGIAPVFAFKNARKRRVDTVTAAKKILRKAQKGKLNRGRLFEKREESKPEPPVQRAETPPVSSSNLFGTKVRAIVAKLPETSLDELFPVQMSRPMWMGITLPSCPTNDSPSPSRTQLTNGDVTPPPTSPARPVGSPFRRSVASPTQRGVISTSRRNGTTQPVAADGVSQRVLCRRRLPDGTCQLLLDWTVQ